MRSLFLRRMMQVATTLLVLLGTPTGLRPQPMRNYDASQIRLALSKLGVLGSALYIAAHPDDENTALLAYLAKGRMVRTAYLAATRGEGGQNLIGPEQGNELGVIRTQELLAARKVDGAEQYFTRAIDFGYSKTSDETLQKWDHESIVGDMVWVIRSFRPDIIITRFSPTLGGHGNHTASAILAGEAYRAAGDPAKYPDQLAYVSPWKPRRLLFNTARFFDTTLDTSRAIKVDLGAYSPLLGQSFTELAGVSRSNHKSQGFGAGQARGPNVNYFLVTQGDGASGELFEGIDLTWGRVEGGSAIGRRIEDIVSRFDDARPAASLQSLIQLRKEMLRLSAEPLVAFKLQELSEIIRACAGIWCESLAGDANAVPGQDIRVTPSIVCRACEGTMLDSVRIELTGRSESIRKELRLNVPQQYAVTVRIPAEYPFTIPYWFRLPPVGEHFIVEDRRLVGQPETPPPITTRFYVTIFGEQFAWTVPVQYRWVDPVDGEQYRLLEVLPPVTLNLHDRVFVFTDGQAKDVLLTVISNATVGSGIARLRLPEGWTSDPQQHEFRLNVKGEERRLVFRVRPGVGAGSGMFRAEADVGGHTTSFGSTTIRYPHIPLETILHAAEGKLLRIDVRRSVTTVGYIMGAGDDVPRGLQQEGFQVHLLSDDDLASADLSKFDAIVAGVRAYNTRHELKNYQGRIFDFVRKGGTYVVQYVTAQKPEADSIGPYPLNVSRDRVSVEEAPVTFLEPHHKVLTTPNLLTQKDFDGWVQERGLYFADSWDPAFQPVLECHDPGEPERKGGLLIAPFGKGYYVYTGLAFFRQIPAGVTGAYRLLANIVSLSR